MKVEIYSEKWREQWNSFVSNSRNGTFHNEREFIEYHGTRFQDKSLLITNNNNILTLLPAHEENDNIYSHKGLSYSGFILSKERKLEENLNAFRIAIEYFVKEGYKKLYYKTIPSIYHLIPSEDDLFFLFFLKAKLEVCNVNPVLNNYFKLDYNKQRKRTIKKAEKEKIKLQETDELPEYWRLITELLKIYNSSPVHSIEEIQCLRSYFPNNIRLFTANKSTELLAGILIFETKKVAKFQYIGSSENGKSLGALDLLLDWLIREILKDKNYIDFGTSTFNGGGKLAMGISSYKEGFGARTTVHKNYSVDLKNIVWNQFEMLFQ